MRDPQLATTLNTVTSHPQKMSLIAEILLGPLSCHRPVGKIHLMIETA
jgi:hypothetical protein